MNNKFWPWVVAIIAITGIFAVTFAVIYLVKVFQYMDAVFNSLEVFLR